MTDKAIRRLHTDIHHLHQAQRARQHDAKELRQDKHELKVDQRHLAHHRDEFVDDRKELKKDRAALGRMRDRERERLTGLDAQEQLIQAQYDATVDPVTGLGDPALKAQLDALQAKQAAVHANFDPKIDATKAEIEKGRAGIEQDRKDLKQDRRELKHDHKALKHDKKALAHAQDRVKNARQHALKDLRPAEYKMGLKQTNNVRKELGLKSVDHVIRPDTGSSKAQKFVAQAMRFLGQPYLWGGGHGATFSKPGPVDCSGLVTQAARMAGFNLDGTAAIQQDKGHAVPLSLSSLKPGDLVFMGDPAHHVGIYIGNNRVLEAPHTGANVRIVSMAGYGWTSARRVF